MGRADRAVHHQLESQCGKIAKAAINDLLAQPEDDFERAPKRVLDKNTELYRRLA